jgi:predicted nucleic acid-binding protein
MSAYYLDSSAVVKRYVDEPGSTWVRQLCDARDPETNEKLNLITLGEIAVVETAAAFAILVRRKVIVKRIADRTYRKFIDEFRSEYDLVHVTPALLLAAAELTQRHPLKAYDAVQLALALHTSKSLKEHDLALIFVSGDANLLQAAQAEGLTTDNPFDHAALDSPTARDAD